MFLTDFLRLQLPPLAQTLQDRKQQHAREIFALEAELAEYELAEAEMRLSSGGAAAGGSVALPVAPPPTLG